MKEDLSYQLPVHFEGTVEMSVWTFTPMEKNRDVPETESVCIRMYNLEKEWIAQYLEFGAQYHHLKFLNPSLLT